MGFLGGFSPLVEFYFLFMARSRDNRAEAFRRDSCRALYAACLHASPQYFGGLPYPEITRGFPQFAQFRGRRELVFRPKSMASMAARRLMSVTNSKTPSAAGADLTNSLSHSATSRLTLISI